MSAVPTGNTFDKYGSSNPLVRRMMAGFFAALDELVPTGASMVLEVGTGEGEVAARLRGRTPSMTVIGVDLPDPELGESWRTLGLPGAFADGVALPFPDRCFDLVLAIEVLEHVVDPSAAIRELARVARRDLVLSVPREPIWRMANLARGRYVGQLGNTPGHIQHWSRSSFIDTVSEHLDVQEVRSPFPWTMLSARVRR